MSNKKPKAAWADEPTPLTDEKEDSIWDSDAGIAYYMVESGVTKDLERRLRHAARLLGAIRVDCKLDGPDGTLDPDLLEQQLGDLEEVLQC